MKKAILSLSGGLDSTCLLLKLLADGYEVKAYSFFYGQRHARELGGARRNVDFLREKGLPVSLTEIDLRSCFNESGSSLCDATLEVPKDKIYNEEGMHSTVVENRNVIFASIIYGKALAWANKTKEDVGIFLGIHANDSTEYPDCRPESRLACELAFRISNWGSERVSYEAPFVNVSKASVLTSGLDAMDALNFSKEEQDDILRNTHSCYSPNEEGAACGRCSTCLERLSAFEMNGVKDPVRYVNR